MRKFLHLIIAVAFCQAAGALGSLFTYPNIESWYEPLEKSVLNPPNWIFGPVWITLYTLMGISLWLIWSKKNKMALGFFMTQLVLNSLWSILFFGQGLVLIALIEMLVLWVFILLSAIWFYKINKVAGLLFIPYLIWVGFASYLTYAVLVLN